MVLVRGDLNWPPDDIVRLFVVMRNGMSGGEMKEGSVELIR